MPIILPKKKRTTHILLLLSMGCVYFAHICSFPTFLPSHIRSCMFFPRNLHEAPCCILNIVLKALEVHPFLLRIASRFTTFHFIQFSLYCSIVPQIDIELHFIKELTKKNLSHICIIWFIDRLCFLIKQNNDIFKSRKYF